MKDTDVILAKPSLDEWIVDLLRVHGVQTLDELSTKILPERNWAQIFLAIDRLSREGKVFLRVRERGEYVISLNTRTMSRD
jgi:hypothetical protein